MMEGADAVRIMIGVRWWGGGCKGGSSATWCNSPEKIKDWD